MARRHRPDGPGGGGLAQPARGGICRPFGRRPLAKNRPPGLVRRKPLLLLRLSGLLLLRFAARALFALLFHEPPRNTRLLPGRLLCLFSSYCRCHGSVAHGLLWGLSRTPHRLRQGASSHCRAWNPPRASLIGLAEVERVAVAGPPLQAGRNRKRTLLRAAPAGKGGHLLP